MGLITVNAVPEFDLDQVHKGDLIRAKHKTWDEARNGMVVSARKDRLIVFYWTGYGNVTNHYPMFASEVGKGEWTGVWTTDMETINSIGAGEGGGEDEEAENSGT